MLKIIPTIFLILINFKVYSIDTKAEQAVVVDYDTNEILFDKKL